MALRRCLRRHPWYSLMEDRWAEAPPPRGPSQHIQHNRNGNSLSRNTAGFNQTRFYASIRSFKE